MLAHGFEPWNDTSASILEELKQGYHSRTDEVSAVAEVPIVPDIWLVELRGKAVTWHLQCER